MFPYGKIFLKDSSVVNSLNAQLWEDSWSLHDGPQMGEFCSDWGLSISFVVSTACEAMQSLSHRTKFNLWLSSWKPFPPACGGNLEPRRKNLHLRKGQRKKSYKTFSQKPKHKKKWKTKWNRKKLEMRNYWRGGTREVTFYKAQIKLIPGVREMT